MTAQSAAERQRIKRRRKAEKGLKKVEVWVPVDSVHIVKELEKQLCTRTSISRGKLWSGEDLQKMYFNAFS